MRRKIFTNFLSYLMEEEPVLWAVAVVALFALFVTFVAIWSYFFTVAPFLVGGTTLLVFGYFYYKAYQRYKNQ